MSTAFLEVAPSVILPPSAPALPGYLEAPQTLEALLHQLAAQGTPNLAALRSKLPLMATLLQKPADEVTIQDLETVKPDLRRLLVARRLSENSVRTYIFEIKFLIKNAIALGWRSTLVVPPAWKAVWQRCSNSGQKGIVTFLMKIRRDPQLVTYEDTDAWISFYVRGGGALTYARRARSAFWKAMDACGHHQVRLRKMRGIPVDQFPQPLRSQVEEILTWKTATYAPGRSKREKIRPITASNMAVSFSCLYGFAKNVLQNDAVDSLETLVTQEILQDFAEWSINQAYNKGQSVIKLLSSIRAGLNHPKYRHLTQNWFKEMVDGVEPDSESELKEKQAAKQIPYALAETIHQKIALERNAAARRGEKDLAIVIRDQLLMLWLVVMPWRCSNLAGCRIAGPRPNLFKGKLDVYAAISKPEWVKKQLDTDFNTEFWQCKFSDKETKAGNSAHMLLPRPLIPLLEEYLVHRRLLMEDRQVDTLFVNSNGSAMSVNQITQQVGELTLRFVGKVVTPHTFRHIVAYGWLSDHPNEYLTLSKLLFHKNLQTTIDCYASRFNESDGACGVERWFESRKAA